MPDLRLSDKVKDYLAGAQGREISLDQLRAELKIDPSTPAWQSIRKLMLDLTAQHLVRPSGRKDGIYKVVMQVMPIKVFGRERRPPVTINFPRDYDTSEQMIIVDDIVMREGDLILISGRSNFGKTGLCLNWCGENIDSHPVLMGNEYTTLDGEPSPRFLNRLDNMNWVQWANGNGEDKFTLLPVHDDYAEHILRDRINIIDWINLDAGEYYLISKVMENIKRALGRGIGIIALQKGEGAVAGRGGQFTKDFADVELLLDGYCLDEILLTMGKVKETKHRVTGRAFAFSLFQGVKIRNFRELQRCSCHNGWRGSNKCEECHGTNWKDKG